MVNQENYMVTVTTLTSISKVHSQEIFLDYSVFLSQYKKGAFRMETQARQSLNRSPSLRPSLTALSGVAHSGPVSTNGVLCNQGTGLGPLWSTLLSYFSSLILPKENNIRTQNRILYCTYRTVVAPSQKSALAVIFLC